MGLDMYLTKRTYVQNWNHTKAGERHEITVRRGGQARADIKPERIKEIVEQVGYWRKANAIHQWFVKHVQDGKDDCGSYYVSEEKLKELKAACDKVLATSKLEPGKVRNGQVTDKNGTRDIIEEGEVVVDAQIAETVLPTQGGFFFGSTDYDQYYIRDIKYTSETLAEILAEEPADGIGGDFYYHASW